MTQLPTLTQYTGLVPDKATMDKDTFANSVHGYLNWVNGYFVPQTNSFIDNMNTLAGEIETVGNNAAASEENAAKSASNAANSEQMAYKWANEDYGVEVTSGYFSATHWATKSYKWAETDEDIEVETGKYSAKHWALKAQASVSALPEGTINDSLIATDKTWSSNKINIEIPKIVNNYKTEPPQLANIPTSVLEGTQNNHITISNYDNTLTYIVTSDRFIHVKIKGKLIYYDVPYVNGTQNAYLRVHAIKQGYLISDYAEAVIQIDDIPIVADDGLANSDFVANAYYTEGVA